MKNFWDTRPTKIFLKKEKNFFVDARSRVPHGLPTPGPSRKIFTFDITMGARSPSPSEKIFKISAWPGTRGDQEGPFLSKLVKISILTKKGPVTASGGQKKSKKVKKNDFFDPPLGRTKNGQKTC
jgi:hypothetical protein